jgi:hypothetical protein
MRIVHHHDRAVLFGGGGKFADRPEIPVHAEDAVGDQQLLLSGGQILHDLPRRIDVAVRKNLDGRAAQARAVDDARVIQLVRDDHVVSSKNRRYGACVGGESALEYHHGFRLFERGQTLFQLHVDGHGAGDGSNRPGARTEPLDGLDGFLPKPGMGRQAEIIVRRKVDYCAAVEARFRLLALFENAELAIELLLFQGGELVAQKCQRIRAHARQVYGDLKQDQGPGHDGHA